ncbi:F-box/LRR-repeat protein At3g48880-like [Macadamia integrifolia]|uniref:F-box/LRR-repeat protein At3g48880-like n=1 Tax=Macadamia integrifolia TaxID=60698 RepID=UPI001C4F4A62|nr:F-box/LRR-repeat protein At3g48880-like [Macadamia integrifolia]
MEGRNWEELNTDCLVKVLERVGMESLILDVPFVCKSWYRASLNPECWKTLRFPVGIRDEPWMWVFDQFTDRFMDEYQLEKFSVTGFVKLLLTRSRRSAVTILLPAHCTSEALELVSNECPALKFLGMPFDLVQAHGELIPTLVSKWKDLQQLHLGSTRVCFKEILTEISSNCENFNGLSVSGYVGNEEASAITNLLPKIKYLWLRRNTTVPRESLQMILEGCKDLVLLDARNCFGFQAEDEEILKMASHIKTFMVEGSCLEDEDDYYEPISYKDACIDSDCGSD